MLDWHVALAMIARSVFAAEAEDAGCVDRIDKGWMRLVKL
jgi:hypothetical protein